MARRDSRLARMNETRQQFFDRKDSNKRIAFERKVVRKLLKGVGVSPVELRVMEPDAGNPNADFYLTLGWLHNEFPDIPVRLMAHVVDTPRERWIPKKRKSSWSNWSEVIEAFGSERKDILGMGCVYLDDRDGKIIVMHDTCFPQMSVDQFTDFGGHVQERCRFSGKLSGEIVFAETLDTFVVQLGNVWRPR